MALDSEETRPLLQHDECDAESRDQPDLGDESTGHDRVENSVEHHTFWFMLPGLATGVLLMCADNGLELAAFVKISSDFRNFNHLGWLSISYTLAVLLIQPLNARLSDSFGRKALLLSSYAFFAVGSLLCATVKSFWALALARAIVGLGGGRMGVMVAIILNDVIPLSLCGIWQGGLQWLVLLGNLSGSQIGGDLVDGPGWRIAFLIETPIAVATSCLVLCTLKLPSLPTQKQNQRASFWDQVKELSSLNFDFGGAALLMVALTALTISLATAGNDVPWSHPSVLTLLPAGIITMAFFLFFESRWASLPLIPARELHRRDLWSIFVLTFFEDFSLTAFLLITPIHVRVNSIGLTSTTGLYLSMVFLGLALGQTIAGGLVRWFRIPWIILLGAEGAVIGITVLLQERWKVQNSKSEDLVDLLLLGLMHGAIKCISLVQLLQATSKETQASLYGAWHIFSSIAIIFASALVATMVQGRFADHLRSSADSLRGLDIDKITNECRASLDCLQELPLSARNVVQASFNAGIRDSLCLATATIIISLFFTLLVRRFKV